MKLKQYLHDAMQISDEHQARAQELWPNARFDMMGQLIIRGDFVLQARSNKPTTDQTCRILRVVGTTPRRLIVTDDTLPDAPTMTVSPKTCLVISQQIAHTIAHPMSIPGVV